MNCSKGKINIQSQHITRHYYCSIRFHEDRTVILKILITNAYASHINFKVFTGENNRLNIILDQMFIHKSQRQLFTDRTKLKLKSFYNLYV